MEPVTPGGMGIGDEATGGHRCWWVWDLWLGAPPKRGDVEAGEVEDAVDDGSGDFVDGFWEAVEGGSGGADDATGEG